MNINYAHENRKSFDIVHKSYHCCVITMRVELYIDDIALSIKRQRLINLKTFFQNSKFKNENKMKLLSRVWSIAV